MSNLVKRILTGFVYVTVVLFALTNPNYISPLFLIVAIFGTFELRNMCKAQFLEFDLYPTIGIGSICYASILYPKLTALVHISIFVYFISELYRTKKTLQNIGSSLLAIVYIFIPLALIIPIGSHSGVYEYKLLFGLLILIWSSDTWAFVVGRTTGKRKLFERLSPNKTWEGFWGSVILTGLTGYVLSRSGFGLNSTEWCMLGGVTVFIATVGDLFQSMLKRASKIKDSGTVLPGHGGVLDRFDSILFCMPAYYIYFYHLRPLLST